MTDNAPVIVWFRQDLRLSDNPAVDAARRQKRPVLPVFILDDDAAGEWKNGAAGRWWLHQSLRELNASLDERLLFFRGDAKKLLPKLVDDVQAAGVYWNRCYEPWRIARDSAIKTTRPRRAGR